MEAGCSCPGGGGYASIDNRICTSLMLRDSCKSVPYTELIKMKRVGGKLYCAKRDTAYTYLTSMKPTKDKDGNYECKDATMSHLCGTKLNKFEHVFCIPAASKCPITDVTVVNG